MFKWVDLYSELKMVHVEGNGGRDRKDKDTVEALKAWFLGKGGEISSNIQVQWFGEEEGMGIIAASSSSMMMAK